MNLFAGRRRKSGRIRGRKRGRKVKEVEEEERNTNGAKIDGQTGPGEAPTSERRRRRRREEKGKVRNSRKKHGAGDSSTAR